MDAQGFRQFLNTRKLSESAIVQHISLGVKFEEFFQQATTGNQEKTPTAEDARAFISLLMQEKIDTYDNLVALARYARFTRNEDVYLVALELVDGAEVMKNLHIRLGKTLGERFPAFFCQCSAGYHKRPWDVIFEQPLKADVLETVLQGDLCCRFAIHLPSDCL